MKSMPATRCGPGGPPINLDLSQVLVGTLDLRDGLSVGGWATFDPRHEGEALESAEQRHAKAKAICAVCTILSNCVAWLAGLPKFQRPIGAVAAVSDHHLAATAPGRLAISQQALVPDVRGQ